MQIVCCWLKLRNLDNYALLRKKGNGTIEVSNVSLHTLNENSTNCFLFFCLFFRL